MPVTASNPIRVRNVAARKAGRRVSVVASNAAMSCWEYKYGTARWRGQGNTSAGGTSVAGALVASQDAKPRTTDSRSPHQRADAVAGSLAHATACSTVTVVAPMSSR